MSSRLGPVWLVAQRELRDQLRDWRVLFPLAVLTLGFPFLMNVFAGATVAFIRRYGADLVIDSLVPFSILIIGFFPNTISLVVALESFVGEKERGTIEPLLGLPLSDWQIYLGKFLIGALTPLISSIIAITLYLGMVRGLAVKVPPPAIIFQLYVLTAAHTVLMVSGAIIVSVQSTSVKAANLLASFIIIPVAFLLQGESVLLFWGNGRILWLAVVAVVILASLLIRVGIAHFQREYLLGREIDVLNVRWLGRTFWASFREGARSIPEWYLRAVVPALKRLLVPCAIMLLIAILGGWLGYDQVTANAPKMLQGTSIKNMSDLSERIHNIPSIAQLGTSLSVPAILFNNLRATTLMFLGGMVSFGVLGIIFYLINVGLIGGVVSLFAYLGVSPFLVFTAGLLPHGLFEIPALLLSGAAVLRMSVALVTPQTGKSLGEVVIELIADWSKVFLGVVVPLLAVAAIIETYITPIIIAAVFK
ncbi:MAG TPA: stage II sporulation protein M [Anaerolineales bacterium]